MNPSFVNNLLYWTIFVGPNGVQIGQGLLYIYIYTAAVKIIQPAVKKNFVHRFFWGNTCYWALAFTTW